MFDLTFYFIVYLPFSRFIFTHHVQLIIKEVDSNVKVVVDPDALALDVYDPQPLKEYVILIEAELLQIRDSLTQALEKRSYTEEQVVKWHLIGDFFYKKSICYESPTSPSPPSSPIHLSADSKSFVMKLDEEVAKQKGEKN